MFTCSLWLVQGNELMAKPGLSIFFDQGTLRLDGEGIDQLLGHPGLRRDSSEKIWRLPGNGYRGIIEAAVALGISLNDQARKYERRLFSFYETREPFAHQREAVDAWRLSGGKGVIVLPTGTGKSFVAMLAIRQTGRPALVVCPTIDLMNQWQKQLEKTFGEPVGMAGGGCQEWRDITVTTYESAYLQVERWGDKFGLLIFDEAHHLPGSSHQLAARGAIAPFRLGLTATLEREDGLHSILLDLIGPTVFRREINDLAGEYLANYSTNRIWVELLGDERIKYEEANLVYQGYLNQQGYSLGSQGGWKRFIWESTRNSEAKSAFRAFLEQKKILHQCEGKMVALENILEQHRKDRILVFTVDNATVHQISRRFLVPSLTHNTRSSERKDLLQGFQEGRLPVLATSRVLNEGVDVPAAGVAVVLSGSGTVREHVQRLGRILRKYEEKQAILYELVVKETREEMVSQRRRRHDAYQ